MITAKEKTMIKKSLIIMGGIACLMMAIPHAEAQSRRAYCDDFARRQAWRQGDPGNVVGGAIGGAVLGGIVGGLTGQGHGSNIATGAAIGGVTGGALGAASTNGYVDQGIYNDAFARCMDRGGYPNRANPVYDRPPGYSRDVQYCMGRYRSYNPNTGMYLSSSGRYRPCP